jgi:MinD-like ATPase involved in chromosome partitioning or flagellar assembly
MKELFALTSAKHAPGVTSAAVALAIAAGPIPASLVVEADPAGGDLAARCDLSIEPGLGSLAASARHGAPIELADHVQPLPAGPFGLLAPPSPSLTRSALAALGGRLADGLGAWAGTVVVDCGRWDPSGPTVALATVADALLVVLRPTLEGVEHVRARLDDLHSVGAARVAALLVGDRPYPPPEVAAALGLPVAGVLPLDPRGAKALERRMLGAETRRSTIVRAARSALDVITTAPAQRTELRP